LPADRRGQVRLRHRRGNRALLPYVWVMLGRFVQEQSRGIHYNKDADLLSYVIGPETFRFVDGHAQRGEIPGLGITVDEGAVRAADRTGHAWRNPVWRHDDGSFAEW
ncbi:hypothetical protein ACWEQN_42940, partial [Streptomyces sp. NPDC004129]